MARKERKEMKETFTVKKIGNMVFIFDTADQIWKCWFDYEFTERKLKNAMDKIRKGYQHEVVFVNSL